MSCCGIFGDRSVYYKFTDKSAGERVLKIDQYSAKLQLRFDDFSSRPYSTVVTIRGHPFKLFKEYSDGNARESFFSQRIINVWNSLPPKLLILAHYGHLKRLLSLLIFRLFRNVFSF